MEDLYIYKTIKEYYSIRKENIPKKVLSLLKNVEPSLKEDINNNYIFPEYIKWILVERIDLIRKQLSDWTAL